MSADHEHNVAGHYSSGDLGERILAALEASGKDLESLTSADLAPVDQFHNRGAEATRELAEFAGLRPGLHVVDVGSGLGGPARHLAAEHGCRVTGIALTEEFCRVATMLTERIGFADKVEFQHGSALDMPFEDGRFDAAWTMHAQMNIEDKPAFYGEIFRVLKPGGSLVFQDLFQGLGGDVHYPVPWAEDATVSFLARPEAAREAAESQGFRIAEWRDLSEAYLAWNARQPDTSGKPLPPLGLHLILGEETAREKWQNQLNNHQEGRVVLVRAKLEKPE
jgi:ubiquinone/menaquinone biosynthesis C-methylase UbiE